ncbi:glycogen debranching protein GlgX [Xylanimonas protaetiae]|uniref:Glycogen debranching enzyme GlgX n=1 Tax=Xylanimonas protaetiae TaxID=2509457 RepID=A0A4P6EZ45_9MICO|nr:glycogen debranching protein GlgX [Xylanimonas protaetiae]QAY68720.1 glycogen debranching enzyme GlgX [Xylanimonas protaetiae]
MNARAAEPPAPRPVVRPLTRPTARRSHVPPLGVTATPGGVDVAVVATHAAAVDFCLIDVVRPDLPEGDPARYAERRVPLFGPTYGVWHAHVPGVRPGQRYGFRTRGAWDPRSGLRHNPAKLLVDPYARGLVGTLRYGPETLGAVSAPRSDDPTTPDGRWWIGERYGEADTTDSLPYVPHSVVMPPMTAPPPLSRPRVPWADTVVYEAHVRGFTLLNEAVPEELRGTYAGMAHPVTIAHLKELGVTTLELLPIHAIASEPRLPAHGLTNFWGYSTLGFFAPEPSYATRAAQESGPAAVLDEVRGMVHLLHQAGIEVILDVVYNHTCEGGDDQLHVSWRGLDNPLYYLHDGNSPAALADVTGTGNSLDFRRMRVVQMALDSLRYWAQVVGVDGFRFDLAVTLGRGTYGFEPDHPFLVGLQTDPVLNNLKLIAEPWDVGPGGWQTGSFPPPMAEWNDRFRDTMRAFWLASAAAGSHGRPMDGVRELTTRLSGSADLFGHSDPPLMRGPVASVNYITAHDGFTLADLVAFDHKHNWANGEDNHDGTSNNLSWNHGVEGHTGDGDDATTEPWSAVVPLRRRSQRNLMAMLLLAAGTPMITAGDEFGRTQDGNNNAYAQDNAISWVDWALDDAGREMLETTRFLLGLRRDHAALRADSFFLGTPRPGEEFADLLWFTEAGTPMDHDAWNEAERRVVQMLRPGPGQGDADVLVVINGRLADLDVTLPPVLPGARAWDRVWSSTWDRPVEPADERDDDGADGVLRQESLSIKVFVARRD